MRGIYSLFIIGIYIMLVSCKADMICPAYQSYFLLDEPTQAKQFSYIAEDSLPRRDLFNPSKDKNGLMVYEEYRSRWLDHKTVPMQVIYPIVSDSALFSGDVMMYAETDVIDSVALDSALMAASTFQYNVDQKYYNWYFRGKLSWDDEGEGDTKQANPTDAPKEPIEKKGLKGLFEKKEKAPKEPKKEKVKKDKSKKEVEQIPDDESEPTQQPVEENQDDGEDDF